MIWDYYRIISISEYICICQEHLENIIYYLRDYTEFKLEKMSTGFIDVDTCKFFVNAGVVQLVTAPINACDIETTSLPGIFIFVS